MAQAPNNNVDQNSRLEANHQGPQLTQDMDQPGPTPKIDIEAFIGPQLKEHVEHLIRAETPINLPFIAALMGPEDGSKHQRFLEWLHRNDNASDKVVHNHVAVNSVVFSDILTYAIQYPEPVNSLLDEIIEDCAQLCRQWQNLSIPVYHHGRDTVYHLMYGHYLKGLANPPRFIDVSLKQIVKRFCSDDEKKAWEQDSKLLGVKSTSAKNAPDYKFKIKVIGLWLEKYPDLTLAACALQVIQDEASHEQQEEAGLGSENSEMEM